MGVSRIVLESYEQEEYHHDDYIRSQLSKRLAYSIDLQEYLGYTPRTCSTMPHSTTSSFPLLPHEFTCESLIKNKYHHGIPTEVV